MKKILAVIIAIVLFLVGVVLIVLLTSDRLNFNLEQNTTNKELEKTTEADSELKSSGVNEGFSKEVTYQSSGLKLKGYLCKPDGTGPFPAVMFNHGGSGDQIGGAPEGTCKELAKNGFVGFSPIRATDKSMDKNLQNVQDALLYLRGRKYVDTKKMGMIGFSRGVLITYDAAIKNPNDFKGLVLMAGGIPSEYADGYSKAGDLKAPVLLLVAENDTPAKLNGNKNMVDAMTDMKTNLEDAGVDVEMKVYPPYSKGHGHTMFFEVGDYWEDVEKFLKKHLK